jgi:hypothetical protein
LISEITHLLQHTFNFCIHFVRQGGTSSLSAGLGHVIPLVVLAVIGCVSSILAPSSTMGVDAVPNEDAADEPLFAVYPVPYDVLYVFGIARQPSVETISLSNIGSDAEIEMGTMQMESERVANIDDDKKRLPGRGEEGGLDTIGETRPTKSTGEKDEALTSAAELEDSSRLRPGLQLATSSRRGWQSEGSYRSYSELQRFGSVRYKSEYAMRSGSSNKRNRSKFFRSR